MTNPLGQSSRGKQKIEENEEEEGQRREKGSQKKKSPTWQKKKSCLKIQCELDKYNSLELSFNADLKLNRINRYK